MADHDQARDLVRRLLAGLPAGSYLSLNEGSRGTDPVYEQAQDAYNEPGAVPYFLRPFEQIEAFFEGLELVEPGVVSVPRWHPEALPRNRSASTAAWAASRSPRTESPRESRPRGGFLLSACRREG